MKVLSQASEAERSNREIVDSLQAKIRDQVCPPRQLPPCRRLQSPVFSRSPLTRGLQQARANAMLQAHVENRKARPCLCGSGKQLSCTGS